MKAIWFLLFISVLALLFFGCGEEVERENPLDAQNKRTGGAPPGLIARAGDSQVKLSWLNLGLDGIKEYRIYRAHLTSAPDQFQLIASIPAEPMDKVREYVYTDTGLQNDGDNIYFYRLSYLDEEDRETPDPENSQILPEDWFLVGLIPSAAPPTPNARVMEDRDLQVRLVWEGYTKTAPEDLAGFKIYSALKAEEGQEQPPFTLAARIDDPKVEFYVDGNDYPNSIINFSKDGTTKLYKVVAFDIVGVESDPITLEGTSPNLPPGPPLQAKGRFYLRINDYDVSITWWESFEPDVIGYVVYALIPSEDETQEPKREFKKLINDPSETAATITDRYIVIGGMLSPKQYCVTAFDNTPKPDGKRDESELAIVAPVR